MTANNIVGMLIMFFLAIVSFLFYLNLPAFVSSNELTSTMFLFIPVLFGIVGVALATRD